MSELVLIRALAQLQSFRDRLVVVGGTAHRLFAMHELGTAPPWELLTTEDVDLAAHRDLELTHGNSQEVLDALREVGFEEAIAGADRPSHRYVLAGAPGYLEFIAPRIGSGQRRNGSSITALRFGGVVAEALPEVDLLLHAPWTATLDEGVEVSIVNPIAYLLQKLLVLSDRRPPKRAKDLLYVYDTLVIFNARWPELRERAGALRPPLTKKQIARTRSALDRFAGETTDDHREAALLASSQRAKPPTADAIARALSRTLPDLLLPD
jgi:hypothetical protein